MLRHKRLIDSDGSRTIGERYHQRSPINNEDDSEDLMWRQAARMSNDDERLLQFAVGDRPKRSTQRESNRDTYSRATPSPSHRRSPESPAPTDNLDDADENSSISLAQSGCHSILSAWRIKSANRAARSKNRPLSVLSNGSSTGKKSAASTVFTLRGKSPASQSRIALGPRAAQHFVTNSRRRRQANELILTTLEARRRALALNRQNASLFGSASYLADSTAGDHNPLIATDELSARLSLSPSPLGAALLGHRSPSRQTPSPAQRHRPTLSDLGGRSSAAAQAQRQRLLLNSAKQKPAMSSSPAPNVRNPPLAKIDQNSSDLYSSNSSSNSDSSSSGSQFTQLVTSELAPDCALLDRQVQRQSPQHNIVTRLVSVPNQAQRPQVRPKPRLASTQSAEVSSPAPQVPERTRRKHQARSPSAERQRAEVEVEEEDDSDRVSNLRRGALKRDSIRRIRLSRAQMRGTSSSDVAPSSSESTSSINKLKQVRKPETPKPELKPLPVTRRLEIESNPFLNRGHFRSSANSMRSNLLREPSEPASAAEQSQAQIRETKRNSWLLGSGSGRRAESAARAANPDRPSEDSKARSLLETRRTNSSESIREQGNKLSKQQENERIKQVEDMLRAMRPNQVFTSYARESESIKSRHMIQTTAVTTTGGQPQISKTSASVLTSSRTQNVESNQKSQAPRPSTRGTSRRLDGGRVVSEESKSHDDLKFGASGSRRERAMQQKWPREKSAEDDRLDRLDLIRSTSISPPAGFADTSSQLSRGNDIRLQRRALSSDAPRPAPEPRHQRKSSPTSPSKLMKNEPVELPKLERTADDEFRKRVDYLRKLARSNLADSPAVNQERRRPIFTTKPMTTNWRNAATSEEKTKELPASISSTKPAVPRRSSPQTAITTNLDALLIADRYQPPLSSTNRGISPPNNFNWRRSNSSLASLSATRSPTRAQDPQPSVEQKLTTNQRPQVENLQIQQPREQATPAAVKLVVREKSAPKLGYAVVEQQPVVQHARLSTNDDSHVLAPRLTNQHQPVVPKQAIKAQARTPLRVASPRSPDFGPTAASSNDDSAIASSVSSPSLSFMTNPANTEQPAQQANPARRVLPSSSQQSGALQSILRRQQLQQQQSQSSESSDRSAQVGGQMSNQGTSMKRGLGNQEPQEPLFRSDARSPEPVRPMSPDREKIDTAMQQTSQQPTPPKRVHFNDRTSIRSFESVSSLASNSTAVPNEMLRQQIGSPDSMGSGSTSRLSAESPDESRRGAAIYAIRGDPELEQLQPQRQQQQLPYNLQQLIPPPPPVRYASAAATYQTANPLLAASANPQRGPYLRMNAPASFAPQAHQSQMHYIARPTSLTSTRLVPTSVPPNFQAPDDDDDPDYALRLRQAATSRAMFNYVSTAPPAQLRQPLHLPPAGQMQRSPQQQQRQQPAARILHLNDLANFQTEV